MERVVDLGGRYPAHIASTERHVVRISWCANMSVHSKRSRTVRNSASDLNGAGFLAIIRASESIEIRPNQRFENRAKLTIGSVRIVSSISVFHLVRLDGIVSALYVES